MKKEFIVIGTAVWVLAVVLIVNFMQSMYIPIIFTIVGSLFISIILWKYVKIYGDSISVQFLIIIVGTYILIIISCFRDFIFPNFDNLPIETSRLFFPLLVNIIAGIFAVFGIAFSILWGSIYVHYLREKEGHGYRRKKLKRQGISLLVFLLYFVLVLFLLFIHPLYLQISV